MVEISKYVSVSLGNELDQLREGGRHNITLRKSDHKKLPYLIIFDYSNAGIPMWQRLEVIDLLNDFAKLGRVAYNSDELTKAIYIEKQTQHFNLYFSNLYDAINCVNSLADIVQTSHTAEYEIYRNELYKLATDRVVKSTFS